LVLQWFNNYLAEQVSHHPPHTSFIYYNIEKGIVINANLEPGYIKFYGNSADSKINGLVFMHVFRLNENNVVQEEVYEMTYPTFLIRGLLIGNLWIEIVGKTHIVSHQTPYFSNITFKSKGMFKNSRENGVSANVYKEDNLVNTLDGFWDSEIDIQDSRHHGNVEFFNVDRHPLAEKIVEPLENQQANESRKFWYVASQAMIDKDEDTAYREQLRIAEEQRRAERIRAENNEEYVPLFFNKINAETYIYRQWNEIVFRIKENLLKKANINQTPDR